MKSSGDSLVRLNLKYSCSFLLNSSINSCFLSSDIALSNLVSTVQSRNTNYYELVVVIELYKPVPFFACKMFFVHIFIVSVELEVCDG